MARNFLALSKTLVKSLVGPAAYRQLCLLRQKIQRGRPSVQQKPLDPIAAALERDFQYDLFRFRTYSCALSGPVTKEQWRATLTANYHKIEKALSLKSPRPGFAAQWITDSFLKNLEYYREHFGEDALYGTCLRSLRDYIAFQEDHSYPIEIIRQRAGRLAGAMPLAKGGSDAATKEVTREEIQKSVELDFRSFVFGRCSIRQFSPEPIEREIIHRAIELASKTPSVCNRQPWFVYAFDRAEDIEAAVNHQPGCDGFAEQIAVLLLVTADLSAMLHPGERFQAWIDGGMFSMSLVYALHSLGVGTCCLNLSISSKTDKLLRQTVAMKDEHSPVMMIAVGKLPERLRVATSPRKGLRELLKWNSVGTATGEVGGAAVERPAC